MSRATINTPELDEQIAITQKRLDDLRSERRRRHQQNARALEQLDRKLRFNDGADTFRLALERLIDDIDAEGDLDTQIHPDDATSDPVINDDGDGDRFDGLG